MASPTDKDASCANDPNFAIICGFFEKFSDILQIKYPNFQQLQEWIANTDEVPNGLRDLHIKLLRKTRKTVHESAWETALSKFCYTYSHQDAWEIERFGYKKSSLKVKLKILRELVESQFERNANFRSKIMSLSADALRFQPIGRDRLGHSYWVTQDNDANLRVYQEHLDEEIWQVVATSREEFVTLINRLKGNEVVLPSEIGAIDEDSSSNSCQAAIQKPPPPEERDDSQDDDTNNASTPTKIPNIKIKLGTHENGVVKNKIENIDSKKVLDKPPQLDISNKINKEEVEFEEEEDEYDDEEEDEDEDTEEDEQGQIRKEPITEKVNKKVKPLIINHSKMSKANLDKPNKRFLDEQEKKATDELATHKKHRPTLLDAKREMKVSRYENLKDESDEEDDYEEEEEEEQEEEEDISESDSDVEDEEKDELEKKIHSKNIVSDPIEEKVLIVKGEGMGNECEEGCLNQFLSRELLNYCYTGNCNEEKVGEAIEEDILFVYGEGSGTDCMVGNTKEETEPKATFFFGQPGCLKLSPVKKSPTLGSSVIDIKNQATTFNKSDDDATHVINGDASDIKELNNELDKSIKSNEGSVSIDSKNDILSAENTPSLNSEIVAKNDNKKTKGGKASPENSVENCNQSSLSQSRKRRLSERPALLSETETDVNSEKFEEELVNIEVVAKRQKLRSRTVNTTARKKIEAKRRSNKEETSSSEEEKSLSQNCCKTTPTKTVGQLEIENIDDLVTKPKECASKENTEKLMPPSDSDQKEVKNNSTKDHRHCDNNDNEEVKKKSPVREIICKGVDECTESNKVRLLDRTENAVNSGLGETNGRLLEEPTILKPMPQANLEKSGIDKESEKTDKKKEIAEDSTVKQESITSLPQNNLKNNNESCIISISSMSVPEDNKLQITEDLENKPSPKDKNNLETEKESEVEIKTETDENKICIEKIENNTSVEDSLVSGEVLNIKSTLEPTARSTRSGRRSCTEVSLDLSKKKRGRVKATNKLEDSPQSAQKGNQIKKENELVSKELIKDENTGIIPKENVKNEVKLEEDSEENVENELKDQSELSKNNLMISPSETITSTPVTTKKTRGGPRKKLEVDTKNIIDADSETPVRQSRRIAQLKIREEADRRKMEEIALKKMKDELKKKKKQLKEIVDDPTVSEPTQSEKEENSEEEAEVKKKIEKQKKKGQKKNGWSSGSEDPEEEEEVEEHYYESDPGSPLFKSDHEFSPESDVEDESQMVPMKRARTARKEGEETIIDKETDEACIKCGKKDHPEWILLCDKCDNGYHCSCLSPVLFYIPEGDWFCPPCQQEQLISALETHLKRYDELVIQRKHEEQERIQMLKIQEEQKQREIEEELIEREREMETSRRQKPEGSRSRNRGFRKETRKKSHRRRRQNRKRKGSAYDENESDESNSDSDGSISNGTTSSYSSSKSAKSNSRSGSSASVTDSDNEPIYKLRKRRQINVSYRLHEYDDLLKSALKEEDDIAGAGNLGRGKDISNIVDPESDENEVVDRNCSGNNGNEPKRSGKHIGTDSADSETEIIVKRKPKISIRSMKKKSRKLNALDVSSEGDNDSDEDFKTSSIEDDDEEEESNTVSSNSDSSLEMFRHRKKRKKNTRRAARRAARERRKVKKFVVEDSDESEIELSKLKKKRKVDSDYSESETNEEDEDVSEDIDSEALCEDSTESDSAWQPGKRKKQSTGLPAKKEPRPKPKVFVKQKKVKRIDESERSFKVTGIVRNKNRILDDDEDDEEDDGNGSSDSGRRTRGKRFTYLEDYEEESSDGGIKPGVKRPDTPPEEREKFIKKQEEIKRMLAEKNTEAAKVAATPTLTPIKGAKSQMRTPEKLDSLSTVPLSVIRQAKALDVDYLQRKGESVSDVADETDFDDDDLPADFNPEDVDEEAIARIMEEEDFSNQQNKMVGDNVVKQKKLKDNESTPSKQLLQTAPLILPSQQTQQQQSCLQEPVRKRLPMPTIHPPLLRNPGLHTKFPQLIMGDHQHQPHLPLLQNALTSPLGQPMSRNIQQVETPSAIQLTVAKPVEESNKPRGRRKKITPLRDPLEKQKAAEAVTASTATLPTTTDPALTSSSSKGKSTTQSIQPAHSKAVSLSVAQPPQLYKPPNPINTQPSVITRMPHLPQRQPPPGTFPDQRSRFYSPPHNQLIGHRPPLRHSSGLVLGQMPPHHNMRPSYAGGPPPLRPVGDPRLTPPIRHQQYRPGTDQYPPSRPRLTSPHINQYRPPIYGNPHSYSPGHSNQQSTNLRPSGPSEYSPAQYGPGPYGYYPPPPPLSVQPQHSNNPPHTQSIQAVPSSVIVAAPSVSSNLRHPPPSNPTIKSSSASSAPTSVVMAAPRVSNLPEPRKKLMTLETFNSKLTPPLADTRSRSPYSASTNPGDSEDQREDDSPPPSQSATTTESTSEFSGLVSYFSSQQDDFNT